MIINLPKIFDSRGSLTSIEELNHIPFKIKKVHWIFDGKSGHSREGHSLKNTSEFLVVISGSVDILTHDGRMESSYILNKPNKGLLIKNGVWRQITNFSSSSVCLILSSNQFDQDEYVRNFNEFIYQSNGY